MLSCGNKVYHLELMLLRGANVIMLCYVIMWKLMLSCGTKCYHVAPNGIIWMIMLSCGSLYYNMGPNAIMWRICYHVEAYVIM